MYDHLFKFLLIGDYSVGKTSLLQRFSNNCFSFSYQETFGIDFKVKMLEIDGKKIKLQIWDTAGQERFWSMAHKYYRGVHGILFVYDITNKKSFENITYWIKCIAEHNSYDAEKIIIGNKCDMDGQREVTKESGKESAIEKGMKFIETSAKASINVEDAFLTLTREISSKIDAKMQGLNVCQLQCYQTTRQPPENQPKKLTTGWWSRCTIL
ncbi:ras-related protein Rab-8B-like [Artemia franciscana]|uniref:Uncharacterized protein n=1 Tax=Artemia franciscana TaxID=6661 RepID=A0AA88HEA2_ARTSF|nr:hypothetical protein QYM36_017874 [Artemia franciscana]